MIQRSKEVNLTIQASFDMHMLDSSPIMMALESAITSVARVTVLQLRLSQQNMHSLIQHLDQPAPHLHTLSICISMHLSRPCIIPSPLLGGTAPRLREVKLVNCGAVDWTTSAFSSLISLCIENANPRVAPIIIVQALQNISRLEHLELVDALLDHDSRSDDIGPFTSTVELLQLANLTLTGEATGLSYVIQSIQPRDCAHICVTVAGPQYFIDTSEAALIGILQAAQYNLHRATEPKLISLNIFGRVNLTVQWSFVKPQPGGMGYGRFGDFGIIDTSPHASISFPVDGLLGGFSKQSISTILELIVASDVWYLSVEDTVQHSQKFWVKLLTPALDVEELSVCGEWQSAFLDALEPAYQIAWLRLINSPNALTLEDRVQNIKATAQAALSALYYQSSLP